MDDVGSFIFLNNVMITETRLLVTKIPSKSNIEQPAVYLLTLVYCVLVPYLHPTKAQ